MKDRRALCRRIVGGCNDGGSPRCALAVTTMGTGRAVAERAVAVAPRRRSTLSRRRRRGRNNLHVDFLGLHTSLDIII